MKETTREIGKQLLSIIRLILFLPLGFLGGVIVRMLLFYILKLWSFGTMDTDSYWSGSAIFMGLITWYATYSISWVIKPKFVSIKSFVICWSFVMGLFVAMTLNLFFNPPYEGYPVRRDVFKTLIPIGVLVWLERDKKNGLYSMEAKRYEK